MSSNITCKHATMSYHFYSKYALIAIKFLILITLTKNRSFCSPSNTKNSILIKKHYLKKNNNKKLPLTLWFRT